LGTNSRFISQAVSRLIMPLSHSVEQISKQLDLACELTQQIIDLASQTEIDDLEELNVKRLSQIESIFSNDKTKIDVVKAKKLMALNSQAMVTLKQQMILNMLEQKKNSKGNTAHNAYMSHSA